MTLLTCRNVSKAFGKTPALRSVSLKISAGELVGLAGANGAGKSTLLRCIAGLCRPDEGGIRLGGFDVLSAQGYRELRHCFRFSYLGSQSQLYNDLSLIENLRFHTSLLNLENPKDSVEKVISAFGLNRHVDKLVRECSQGIMRRAALARCFLGHPKLVLLDEPLANLDAASRAAAADFFSAASSRQTALLVSTHDGEFLNQNCTRVLCLKKGALLSEVPSHSLPLEVVM